MKNQLAARQRARRTISFASLLLFPVTIYYLSPAVCVMGAFEGIVSGSLVAFAALFVSSLLLGRSFCSWLCPAGAAQDCAMRVNDRPLANSRRIDLVKYFIWVPWLGLIGFAFLKAGGVRAVEPLYLTDHGVSIANIYGYVVYYVVLALFLVPAFVGRRRLACHALCWMAPFMALGSKIKRALPYPALRLHAEAAACSNCKLCERRCPMSLPVSEMVSRADMEADECILCGECVDACPNHAISLAWAKRSSARRTK
jgi:polyferredoxin